MNKKDKEKAISYLDFAINELSSVFRRLDGIPLHYYMDGDAQRDFELDFQDAIGELSIVRDILSDKPEETPSMTLPDWLYECEVDEGDTI